MVLDIWRSFRRIPLWVQIWVVAILVPVNAAEIFFVGQPLGLWVAVLAIGGMLPNLAIMARERGLSRAMAWPHVFIWTPLVVLLIWMLARLDPLPHYAQYLALLLIIDLISLAFDYVDALKWWRGERAIA